jgi:hypothetical protein
MAKSPHVLMAVGGPWWHECETRSPSKEGNIFSHLSSGILLRTHFPVLDKFAPKFPCDGVYLGGPIPLGTVPLQRGPSWKSHFSLTDAGFQSRCLRRVFSVCTVLALGWKESQKILGGYMTASSLPHCLAL